MSEPSIQKRNGVPHPDLSEILGPGNFHRLSRESGVSWQHVSRVLRGRIGVRMVTAKKIADAAGVRVEQMMDYIDSGSPLPERLIKEEVS